jgi:hypothetical protein
VRRLSLGKQCSIVVVHYDGRRRGRFVTAERPGRKFESKRWSCAKNERRLLHLDSPSSHPQTLLELGELVFRDRLFGTKDLYRKSGSVSRGKEEREKGCGSSG